MLWPGRGPPQPGQVGKAIGERIVGVRDGFRSQDLAARADNRAKTGRLPFDDDFCFGLAVGRAADAAAKGKRCAAIKLDSRLEAALHLGPGDKQVHYGLRPADVDRIGTAGKAHLVPRPADLLGLHVDAVEVGGQQFLDCRVVDRQAGWLFGRHETGEPQDQNQRQRSTA